MLLVILYFASSVYSVSHALSGGYVYPQPHPPEYQDETNLPQSYLPPNLPPVFDEVPEVGSTYLPSNSVYPPFGVPALDVQPPVFDTPGITETDDSVIVEVPPLPPQFLPPNYQYIPLNRQTVSIPNQSLKISNLSCVDSTDELSRFYAELRTIKSFKMSPSVNAKTPADCLNVISENLFRIQLEGPKVRECGVRRCITANSKQTKMCINLRMATVKGIKLPEDLSVSLQCIPQPVVLAHTKEIRFRPQTKKYFSRQRSIERNVAVASGGSRRKLDMKLDLLRKSGRSGEFNEIVQAETPVFLGEELMLRAFVKDGNGWHNSKMDSVVMKSASTQQFVTLIDENGCTNPVMRNICPNPPKQMSPLVVVLPFRAFLFQDSDDAEEMVLSLRIMGCLSHKDCLQANHCNNLLPIQTKKRSIRSNKIEEKITDAEVKFKVLPFQKIKRITQVQENSVDHEKTYAVESLVSILSIILLSIAFTLVIIIIILLKRLRIG